MDSFESPVITDHPRKRMVNIKNRKRYLAKIEKYKRKDMPEMPKCKHSAVSLFKCNLIRTYDALEFSNSFYCDKSKVAQDTFILKHCTVLKPSRTDRNVKQGARKRFSVEYIIRTRSKESLKVCQNAFLNILGITKSRVRNICKAYFETGKGPVERRGGDRKSRKYEVKKQNVIDFIKKYKTIETHYCRNQIYHRQYLAGDLSINKMWLQFKKENPETEIKSNYFRFVFNTNFNLGFKSPATDMCSTCLRFKEQLKIETDMQKKIELMTMSRVHKLRSKAFTALLNEEADGLLTMSFDCQKNMTLPKVADQAAYYSRQLYLYLFGMVVGTGHSPLTPHNVFLYYWTENCLAKGSNQIASAVYHRLCNLELNKIHTVRLVADGCGGQNKNSTLVGMCQYWLLKVAPKNVLSVELVFPVPGHSYIPPDRVFAQIEKQVRTKETMIDVGEYLEIYKERGTIVNLGSDECPAFDFKTEINKIQKPPSNWHFKFNQCKRFILTKSQNNTIVQIRGEPFYKSDIGVSKTNNKRGENLANLKLTRLTNGIKVKDAKLKDVDKLLQKHFGPEWRGNDRLSFYKTIIDDNQHQMEEDYENMDSCTNHAEQDGMRI